MIDDEKTRLYKKALELSCVESRESSCCFYDQTMGCPATTQVCVLCTVLQAIVLEKKGVPVDEMG